MLEGTLIEKTSHDLALAVAANIPTSGLSIDVQRYYLANKHLIPEAILRGFAPSGQETKTTPALPVGATEETLTPISFKTADTDLAMWIAKAEEFSEQYLGVEISLREMFAIPEEIPWLSAIPVFDPGGDFTNRKAVELLKRLGLAIWEEVDVMRYSGSGANAGPKLWLIQNSLRPDEDTLGMSPDQLVATEKNWLDPRGYALAFGLYHFVTQKYLDPKTFTRFPKARLSSGKVAHGICYPDDRRVKFSWYNPGDGHPNSGARLAIHIPLLS